MSKKMVQRVVLIRSNPVSPDPPVEKMAYELVQMGHSVTVLAWDRSDSYKETQGELVLSDKQVPIVHWGIKAVYGGGKKTFAALAKFQLVLHQWLSAHKNEYDVIHAFDFDTGWVAQKCAKRYHKKMVYHILDFYTHSHSLEKGILAKLINRSECKVINYANATIICTEKRKEQIIGSNPRNLVVIHNTPKEPEIEESVINIRGNSDRCRIVYVGILAGGRFLNELMEFIAHDNRFELHIGGFGQYEERLKDYVQKYDNIFYYGKLLYHQTLALERSCNIMTAIYDPAVPNHKYAAPNKFYESLMLGKPVIMAKNTGFDEIIKENKIGFLMDYSHEGLAEALNYLLKHKDEWDEMSQRSQNLYNEHFSWEIMKKRIFDLYDML